MQTIMSVPTTPEQGCLFSREQILDRFFQTLKVNWFSQMLGEPCLSGLVYILLAAETAERDSRQILVEADLTHQVVTASVRQSNIADK